MQASAGRSERTPVGALRRCRAGVQVGHRTGPAARTRPLRAGPDLHGDQTVRRSRKGLRRDARRVSPRRDRSNGRQSRGERRARRSDPRAARPDARSAIGYGRGRLTSRSQRHDQSPRSTDPPAGGERRGRRRDGAAPITPTYISVALGSAYFRTNAFADAEREWRAALQVDPKLGEAHNNLAVVLMLTGRFDEAEREVDLAEKSGHK